ncbi:MAG: PEP/pyruvate-binding domain-containing protein, partial [Methanobacterium sp.]|nr:PEP/pyruvate-binding domain-containing protein [Methanobacterium sp.]
MEKKIKTKNRGYFLKNGENTLVDLKKEEIKKPSLDEEVLKKLLRIALELESFFGAPQDIEWALEEEKKQIFILQSRPVTTLSTKDKDDI